MSTSTDLVYVFSSRSRVAYARDILNVTCLPHEIVYLFRYYHKFVPIPLRESEALRSAIAGKEAIIVFADIVEGEAGREYRFVPIRRTRMLDPTIVGSVVYVPFQLKEFIDLGNEKRGELTWRTTESSGAARSLCSLATKRTRRAVGPNPKVGARLAFKTRYDAAEFVRAGEAEGLTFEGKEVLAEAS
jgi:hypothetical protein